MNYLELKKKALLMQNNKKDAWSGYIYKEAAFICEGHYWRGNGDFLVLGSYNIYFLKIPKGAKKIKVDNIFSSSATGYGLCTKIGTSANEIRPWHFQGYINFTSKIIDLVDGYKYFIITIHESHREKAIFEFLKE